MDRSFFLYLLPSLARALVGLFFLVPITTYYLSPKDYGVISVVVLFTSLLELFATNGVAWVLPAHFFSLERKERRFLVGNLLLVDFLLRATLACAGFFLAPFVLPYLITDFEPGMTFLVNLSLISFVLAGPWLTLYHVLILSKRARHHAYVEVGSIALGAAATAFFLRLGFMERAIFLGTISTGLFTFLSAVALLRNEFELRPKKRWLKEIFRKGLPSISTSVMDFAGNSTDKFLIQRWVGLADLGLYHHAVNYKNMFMLGTKSFNRSFVPDLLRSFNEESARPKVRAALGSWYGLLTLGGLAVCLGSRDFIELITHGKFTEAARFVPIFYLVTLCSGFGMPHMQYLVAKRDTRYLVRASLATGLLSIVVNALFIWRWGPMGAAVSVVVSSFFLQVAFFLKARRSLTGLNQLDLQVAASMACIVAAYFIAGPESKLELWMKLSFCALVAAGYFTIWPLQFSMRGKVT